MTEHVDVLSEFWLEASEREELASLRRSKVRAEEAEAEDERTRKAMAEVGPSTIFAAANKSAACWFTKVAIGQSNEEKGIRRGAKYLGELFAGNASGTVPPQPHDLSYVDGHSTSSNPTKVRAVAFGGLRKTYPVEYEQFVRTMQMCHNIYVGSFVDSMIADLDAEYGADPDSDRDDRVSCDKSAYENFQKRLSEVHANRVVRSRADRTLKSLGEQTERISRHLVALGYLARESCCKGHENDFFHMFMKRERPWSFQYPDVKAFATINAALEASLTVHNLMQLVVDRMELDHLRLERPEVRELNVVQRWQERRRVATLALDNIAAVTLQAAAFLELKAETEPLCIQSSNPVGELERLRAETHTELLRTQDQER